MNTNNATSKITKTRPSNWQDLIEDASVCPEEGDSHWQVYADGEYLGRAQANPGEWQTTLKWSIRSAEGFFTSDTMKSVISKAIDAKQR